MDPKNDIKTILEELIKMGQSGDIDAIGVVVHHPVGNRYETIHIGGITDPEMLSAIQEDFFKSAELDVSNQLGNGTD